MPFHKYVVELVGTFFLVLTIGMCVIAPGAGVMAPLAIGGVLMAMVYAGGHISGAHYNPAVTMAIFLRGKCPANDVGPYMGSQVLGAVLAAMAVSFLKGSEDMAAVDALSPVVEAVLLAEFLFAFALCYVVLNVATAKGTENNSYYGMAIGFTVLAGTYAVGSISGGAFNPAVAVGMTTMGLLGWESIFIFLIAHFAGAAAASFVFRFVAKED